MTIKLSLIHFAVVHKERKPERKGNSPKGVG